MADHAPVIGLGNELRGDDGAGPRVAELLARRGYGAIPLNGEPISLLEHWQEVEAAIVVDAVAGTQPGRIWRWEPGHEELPLAFAGGASTHLLGLTEVIELGSTLGQLPPELTVIGIEGSNFELGAGLSPPLERAAVTVAAAIAAELGPAVTVAGAGASR